jgi:uncharacterized membrane protein
MKELLSNSTTQNIYLISISTFYFLLLDFIFLYYNRDTFEKQIIQVQRVSLKMKPIGGIFCYLFLIIGLYYFILREQKTPLEAFLFGLVIYGVYETTTYALLKNWNITTVITDTLWGGVLFYLTTFFTYLTMDKIFSL